MAKFKKGVSGNPGGRPKGLAAYVQQLCGKDGKKLVDLFWAIAKNPDEKATDRIAAGRELFDRGWNKPTQGIHFDEQMRPLVIDMVTEADVQKRRDESED